MPIYEYHCERCDQTFEVIQKFSDEPLATHEGCGGAVEKLLSQSALQFKGTGWYVTDYARKNGASGAGKKESKESASDSSKSDSSKKESKPAPGGRNQHHHQQARQQVVHFRWFVTASTVSISAKSMAGRTGLGT